MHVTVRCRCQDRTLKYLLLLLGVCCFVFVNKGIAIEHEQISIDEVYNFLAGIAYQCSTDTGTAMRAYEDGIGMELLAELWQHIIRHALCNMAVLFRNIVVVSKVDNSLLVLSKDAVGIKFRGIVWNFEHHCRQNHRCTVN